MFEKVNPSHPDKVADRIAGAIVDLAYTKNVNPKVAVEVLLGHRSCLVIIESSEDFSFSEVHAIVERISGYPYCEVRRVRQDAHLAANQERTVRCGDNGIFKGMPVTDEQKNLSYIAREIYKVFSTDGKYVLNNDKLIICQSNAPEDALREMYHHAVINPLGYWTGGPDVDSGATNRKLGSDMGDGVTGGGLHGKDLSKADVSVNIWCHLEAQRTGKPVQAFCAIGDTEVNGVPYSEIVEAARNYINKLGGFEKFAEWGLI